jgi:hypothetical protein
VVEAEPDLRSAIRGMAAEARRGVEHPAPEELLDYHSGDLAPAETQRNQEHLALCPVCARTLLDLDSFPDVEPVREEDRLTAAELTGQWRRFQDTAQRLAPSRERPRPASPAVLALAAALLFAVVGLSLWNVQLRNAVRDLSQPEAGVLVADLVPRGEAIERAEGGEDTVRVPPWADRVLLILNLADPATAREYRVEIATQDGREVWSRRGVHRSADGTFALQIPRRFLPPGRYRIRLSGLRDGAEEPVAEYGAQIVHE